jgi:hypothetical protein
MEKEVLDHYSNAYAKGRESECLEYYKQSEVPGVEADTTHQGPQELTSIVYETYSIPPQ